MSMTHRGALIGIVAVAAAACSLPPRREPPAEPAPRSPEIVRPAPPKKPVLKRGGGFYKDDGPADEQPENLDAIADAVPRWEPLHKGAQKPYVVLGRQYVPNVEVKPYRARGVASWYGRKFHGQKTSIGEPYDMFAMTAAHTTLALPSYVRVSNPENGRAVIVRLTDRGPFHADRIIDLSYAAAYKLGITDNGSGVVDIAAIIPGEAATAYAQAQPRDLRPDARPAALDKAVDDELGELIGRLEKAEPQPLTVTTASAVWLQLGAFANPDNAESLRAHLARALDWLTEPIRIHTAGGIQRVQAGPYRSRADAEKVAERIRSEFGTRPALVIR